MVKKPFVSIHQLEAIAQLLLGTTDHVSTVLDNCNDGYGLQSNREAF